MPLDEVDRDRVWSWLAGFPQDVLLAAQRGLDPGSPTWVVEANAAQASFRMTARQLLTGVFQSLDKASATLGGEAHVVWCLENWDNRGLDDFEAEFVFGQRMAIDAVGQLDRGQARSRLVVIGRLRVEALGLCFHLGPTESEGLACLKALRQHGIPVATLLVDHMQAQALLATPDVFFTQQLRGLVQDRLVALALRVPPQRSEAALADLARELEPIRQLVQGGEPASGVCFMDSACIDSSAPLLKAMAAGGLYCDMSLTASPHQPAASPDLSLHGPYYRTGAYQPMPFDPRVPAGVWSPDGCVEIPRLPLTDFKGDWDRLALAHRAGCRSAGALDRFPAHGKVFPGGRRLPEAAAILSRVPRL